MFKVVILCSVIVLARGATNIRNFIKPCSIKDSQIESCILTRARELLPQIMSGVRDWNLSPLDPLFISKLSLSDSGNTAVNLMMKADNMTFIGIKDIQIDSVKADVVKHHYEFKVTLPDFSGTGKYDMKGKVLLLPINGQGDFEFHYFDYRALCSLDCTPVEKKGKMFLRLNDVRFNMLEIPRNTQRFDNLFGNKQLSDNMNKVLNQNSKAFVGELRDRIDECVSTVIFAVLETMFDHLPMTDLYTDIE